MWAWKLLKLFLNHNIIINSSLIPASDLAIQDGILLACIAGWIITSVRIEALTWETYKSVRRMGKRHLNIFHVFGAHFPRLCGQTLTHKDEFRQLRELKFFEFLRNVKELFCKLESQTLSKTQAKGTDLQLFFSALVIVNLTNSIVKKRPRGALVTPCYP